MPGSSAATRPDDRLTTADWVVALALVVLAWVVYRPDLFRVHDYIDFPPNVAILQGVDGFGARFAAFSEAYRLHGRWHPITTASWVLQWSLFGWHAVAWRCFRFAIMAGVVVAGFAFYRRLGLARLGAVAAAAMFVVCPAAVPGWLRLGTAEPLGTLFVLIAAHASLVTDRRVPTMVDSVVVAVCCIAAMWTKEMIAAAFILPGLLLLERHPDADPAEGLSRRFRLLYAPVLAGLVGAAPVVWTLLTAPAQAYAFRYGSHVSLVSIAGSFVAGVAPFAPSSTASHRGLLFATGALLATVMLGTGATLRYRTVRPRDLRALALGVVVPLTGAVIYAPWPNYLLVYALPFVAGGSLLLGQGISALWRRGGVQRWVALVGGSAALSYATVNCVNEVARLRALQLTMLETVQEVSRDTSADTAYVALSDQELAAGATLGPTLRTYASVLGLRWPSVRDISCSELGAAARRPRSLGVVVADLCQPTAQPPAFRTGYAHREWPLLSSTTEYISVAFLDGSPGITRPR